MAAPLGVADLSKKSVTCADNVLRLCNLFSSSEWSPGIAMAPKADSNLRPHERFFLSDGSLYLSVEDCLYRVHRSLFEIHASRFPLHEFETCFNKPYTLEAVKTIDFDRFLTCLYPRKLLVDEAETTEEWLSILRLASRWGFETLRSRAISKIEHTLASPLHMVRFGHQYDIPDIFLHGYAILCQSTTPLSSEEGRRLGVEDVVNIYRIRHELYGSAITPVTFEEALEKVRISLSNEEHQDEKCLEAERPDPELDDQQSSEWTDTGSTAASPTSLVEEATADTHVGTDSFNSYAGSLDADPTSQTAPAEEDKETIDSGNNTLVGAERPEDQSSPVSEQERTDDNTVSLLSATPLDAFPSAERSGTQEDPESEEEQFDKPPPEGKPTLYASSSKSGGSPTTTTTELSGSSGQVLRFLNDLTANNFEPFTRNILEWFKAIPESQALNQIARLIVERATEEQPAQFDILVRLCKEMVKRLSSKVQNKGRKGKVTSGGHLFRDYLGNICHERLKDVAASAVAGVRRQRLIEFIGELGNSTSMHVWTPDIIDKWVTALLDINDEEKVKTLCLLMTRAGPLWDTRKLCTRMSGWCERMSNVAQRTNKPRIRTLLEDIIKLRGLNWVAS